jgi:hypothetical protein
LYHTSSKISVSTLPDENGNFCFNSLVAMIKRKIFFEKIPPPHEKREEEVKI